MATSVKTSEQLESPVTVQELADWIGVESADTVLAGILNTATGLVIAFLQRDLMTREWVATVDSMPLIGGDAYGLSAHPRFNRGVVLPYGVTQVTSVKAEGVELENGTDYEVDLTTGCVYLKTFFKYDISITYKAGFGEEETDVPEEIKTGIKMLASWLYDNRGGVPAGSPSAIVASGAKDVIYPFRIEVL
jgi:uncharacterized phiE125 gp8 family phage protein